ncbi:MAG: hypothetical protein PHD60_05650 [Clostridia bacterium]|nr:hypothetical protein [Clostridia bacterium]
MRIEQTLREYKKKKSIVETTLARIEAFQVALENPDMYVYVIVTRGKELGTPIEYFYNGSTVENEIFDKEKAKELLKEWIAEDRERIFFIKLEVEQIEIALNSLTTYEKYVIESKYFNNLFWRDIETSLMRKFPQKFPLTVAGIKKINREALDRLDEIMSPFCPQTEKYPKSIQNLSEK